MAGTAIPFGDVPQVYDNGSPLSGGKIYFYVPETSTSRAPFSDTALSVPTTNPVLLNSAGWPATNIYLDSSLSYDYIIMSADDSETLWPRTTIPAASAELFDATTAGIAALIGTDGDSVEWTGMDTFRTVKRIVTNYAAMTALTTMQDGDVITVLGRTTAGDGGGGHFQFFTSDKSAEITADTVNGVWVGTDADATGASGAWMRMFSGPVDPAWYGAKGDYDPTTYTGTDDSAAILGMLTHVSQQTYNEVDLGSRKFRLGSAVVISQNTDFHLTMYGAGEDGGGFYVDADENTTGAISVTITGATKIVDIHLSNFSIYACDSTDPASPTLIGYALKLVRNPVPGLRLYSECSLDQIYVGTNNNTEAHFAYDFYLAGLRDPIMRKCSGQCLGTATTAFSANEYDDDWPPYLKTASLYVEDCYGFRCYDSEFRGGANCIVFTSTAATEGGYFFNCVSIWGITGVLKDGISNEPAFQWLEGHVNYRDYGFRIKYGKTGTIRGVLLYNINSTVAGDGVAVPIHIWLESTSGDQWTIEDNRLYFDGNAGPGASAQEYIRSDVATSKTYYIHNNKIADGYPLKYGFRSGAAKHTVFAHNNEFQTATTASWSNNGATGEQFRDHNGYFPAIYGAGSPESVVTAPTGAFFYRMNGARGSLIYFKVSGSGNTGWQPIDAPATAIGADGAIVLGVAYSPSALADATHAVNTTNKVTGKLVRVSTTGGFVCAAGTGATDTWEYSDGTTAYTPS
jgi:hypothetical protein